MRLEFGDDTRPIPRDYTVKEFKDQQIILPDLFRAYIRKGADVVIKGVSFTNCRIEGPAVLMPLGRCVFDQCHFGYAADGMKNLILYPASETAVTGAVAMQDCQFHNVDFFGIGFTGERAFLDSLLLLKIADAQP